MARFGIQGSFYFGPQDAVAGVTPTISSVNPTTPEEGQTGVLINGTGFGAVQGTGGVTYNGVAVTVTNWTDTQITVNWPAVGDSTTIGFESAYNLIVTADGGGASPPFAVTTAPQAGYQYVLIGTRNASLPVDEALFDDDTLGTGQTYVYGIENPVDGQWDFTGLANWYINSVPDGGTFTYRLWDVDLGQWSNEATEDFTVAAGIAVENVIHGHTVSAVVVTTHVAVGATSVNHAHMVGSPSVATDTQIAVVNAAHVHTVGVAEVTVHVPVAAVNAEHAQAVDQAAAAVQVGVSNVLHAHVVDLVEALLQIGVSGMQHGHQVTVVAVSVDDPPVLTVPNDRQFFYADPPGTGVPLADPLVQAWLNSATAFDDEDGDITGDITNDADTLPWPLTEADGFQTVTWSVTDSAGQTAQDTAQISARVAEEAQAGAEKGLNLAISLEI